MSALVLLQLVPLLLSHGLAAPRTGSRSEQSDSIGILNPFTPGPDHLSLLQGYLKEKDPLEENASNMKRETAILHLFVLHDFDKSGHLDGLELMRLLCGILTKSLEKEPAQDSVVSLVDEVLERQDIDMDGLLSAQELVAPPVYKEEDAASVHLALPPPLGAQTGDLPVVLEPLEELEMIDRPGETKNVPEDSALRPAGEMKHPEEPGVEDQVDALEETFGEIQGLLESEEEKPDSPHVAGNQM